MKMWRCGIPVLMLMSACADPETHPSGGHTGITSPPGDSGETDTAPIRFSLAIGEVPPDFTLVDTNPASVSYEEPVTVSDKTGFVTGWYFFKSS